MFSMEHRVDAFYGSQAKESNEIGTTRLPLGGVPSEGTREGLREAWLSSFAF